MRIAFLFALLLVVLAVSDSFSSERFAYQNWPWSALLLLLLCIAFRLLDDLSDRDRDKRLHPQRVLCMPQSLTPYVVALVLAAVLIIIGVFLIYGIFRSALLFAILILLLNVYTWISGPGIYRLTRENLILLKYPAMILLFSTNPMTPVAMLAAGFVYVVIVVFDSLSKSQDAC